jgi:hypothetical protein
MPPDGPCFSPARPMTVVAGYNCRGGPCDAPAWAHEDRIVCVDDEWAQEEHGCLSRLVALAAAVVLGVAAVLATVTVAGFVGHLLYDFARVGWQTWSGSWN